ncbi:MAG: hypothetical protein Kow0099_21730 [Candidatus Abyssubacteria bacterium]
MAQYFNAKQILPPHLVVEVLKHIPRESRSGAVLYFSEDYYTIRNHEVVQCFHIYEADPAFGGTMEIYRALSEQFGLTVRQIEHIVCGKRESRRRRGGRPVRRYSGIRVRRLSRRMEVRTVAPG